MTRRMMVASIPSNLPPGSNQLEAATTQYPLPYPAASSPSKPLAHR